LKYLPFVFKNRTIVLKIFPIIKNNRFSIIFFLICFFLVKYRELDFKVSRVKPFIIFMEVGFEQ